MYEYWLLYSITSCIQGWTWRRVHVVYTRMHLEKCTRPVYKEGPWETCTIDLCTRTELEITRPAYRDGLRDVFSSCLHGKSWKLLLVLYTRMDLETCTRPVYKGSPGEVYSFCIQGWTCRRLLVLYTRRWTWRRLLVLYARMDLKTCTRPVYKDGHGDVHSSCIQGWTWRRLLVLYAVWTRRPVLTSTTFSSSWHLILPRLSLKWN